LENILYNNQPFEVYDDDEDIEPIDILDSPIFNEPKVEEL